MKKIVMLLTSLVASCSSARLNLGVGDQAPKFILSNHRHEQFDLTTRRGLWTVLYFYPKAFTPGCTKQACGFRDNIKKIRALGAEVYGISFDTIGAQSDFHEKHQLPFDLLADDKGHVINLYHAKMPLVGMSKRWTFILTPELKIGAINKDVDPILDATMVAKTIEELQAKFKN